MSNRNSASQATAPKGSRSVTRPPTLVVPAKAGTSSSDGTFSARRLLELYDQVAEAPDAVERLRKFVLDLAVRGKLVEQNDEERPHGDLLKLIPAPETEAFDSTLTSWLFPKIGEVLKFCYGKGLKKSQRLERGPVPVYGSNGIVGFTTEPLADSPAIIIGRKGSAGALNFCNGPSWTTDVAYFVEVPPYFEPKYLFLGLQALDLDRLAKGVKPGLSRADAYELRLPIPPLAEQGRIVDRVNELMALLDRLETTRTQRETTRNRLTTASLTRLTAPETTEADFPVHVRFGLDNLDQLTSRPRQIKVLRKTILNLAVRGKLVNQDSTGEAASDLLKRIHEVRDAAIKGGQFRKQRTAAASDASGANAALPDGWAIARLGDVFDIRDGTHDTPNYVESGIPLVTSKNLSSGMLCLEGCKQISDVDHEAISKRSKVDKGDVLFAMIGSIGNPVIVDTDVPFSIKNVALFKHFSANLSCPKFLKYFLAHATEEMRQNAPGGLQPFVSLTFLRNFSMWVPPLKEQHRIAKKVDTLLTLCDRLGSALATSDVARTDLSQEVLRYMLASNLKDQAVDLGTNSS